MHITPVCGNFQSKSLRPLLGPSREHPVMDWTDLGMVMRGWIRMLRSASCWFRLLLFQKSPFWRSPISLLLSFTEHPLRTWKLGYFETCSNISNGTRPNWLHWAAIWRGWQRRQSWLCFWSSSTAAPRGPRGPRGHRGRAFEGCRTMSRVIATLKGEGWRKGTLKVDDDFEEMTALFRSDMPLKLLVSPGLSVLWFLSRYG